MKKILIPLGTILGLVILVPLGTLAVLHAGRQGSDIVVDGSQHPELIPDERAYHMVLLTASATERSSDLEKKRANAVVNSLHLSDQDRLMFADLAVQYREGLEALQDAQRSLPVDNKYEQTQADIYDLKQQLLSNRIGVIKQQLTPTGAAQVSAYANQAKRHMKLFALPDMTHGATGIIGMFRRFFSLRTVHAQMNPSGTAYSNVSGDSSSASILGYAITDATSSCGCHQTRATADLYYNGLHDSSYVTGAEYSDALAGLTLDESQFANSGINVDGTHWAYCPICGCEFVNTTTSAAGSSRFIQAYYRCSQTPGSGGCDPPHVYVRCTPRGDLCDTAPLFRSPVPDGGYPLYGLFNALLVSDAKGDIGCFGGRGGTRADSCITPDPRP